MTVTELSKKLIQLWQMAEWDSLEEFLSEDIELIILGIDPCIAGKNNVLNVLKLASKASFSDNTKINKLLADDNYAVIQLDSNRSTSFLKSPIPIHLILSFSYNPSFPILSLLSFTAFL